MPDQVQTFLKEANQAINPNGTPPVQDPNLPKVPFQTELKLTAQQEKKMIEHAFQRKATLENETGRDVTMNPQWWMAQGARASNSQLASQGLAACETFMGKRCRYDATFLNDFSWRPWTTPLPNIFVDSNLAIPLVRRICRQMIARAKNAFFGAEPWFSVDPAPVPEFDPVADAERAEDIERFCRFKLGESNSKESLGDAISRALIFGECAVKTSYVVRDQIFDVEARVLHNVNGEPVQAADGNYITEDDEYKDAEDGTGRMVLVRDGVTEQDLAPIWQKAPIKRRQVLFEGARSEVIYYKDFIAPLTATDIQTADTVIHLYDKPVAEFVDLVVKRGLVGDSTDERVEASRKMLALVKNLSDNSSQPKAAADSQLRPNENYAAAPMVETGGPISEFAEFYLWFDANQDGIQENILLICDRNTMAPIFYDTMPNVTINGLRPLEIVRVNPVAGRWYGQGIMELFQSYQDILDLQWNRWNYNQSASGRVVLWTPTNTVEGDSNPNLNMQFGKSYQKKPGRKKDDVVEVVYLNDIKFEQIHLMLQHTEQLLMNESGVSNANDNQSAGMASSKLATGVIEVAKSGDELFEPVIEDLKGPLTRILDREIEVTLANINPQEAFVYLEGDQRRIGTITPDDVRGLKYKTVISLTTLKDNAQLQMSAQAIALVEKFYLLPPNVQMKVAPFYRQQLRKLDPQANADEAIVPDQPVQAPEEPTKTGINVAAKLELLTPEERVVIMDKLGVTETVEQAARAPKPPPKANGKSNGSSRLGDAGTHGNTGMSAQLTQAATPSRS